MMRLGSPTRDPDSDDHGGRQQHANQQSWDDPPEEQLHWADHYDEYKIFNKAMQRYVDAAERQKKMNNDFQRDYAYWERRRGSGNDAKTISLKRSFEHYKANADHFWDRHHKTVKEYRSIRVKPSMLGLIRHRLPFCDGFPSIRQIDYLNNERLKLEWTMVHSAQQMDQVWRAIDEFEPAYQDTGRGRANQRKQDMLASFATLDAALEEEEEEEKEWTKVDSAIQMILKPFVHPNLSIVNPIFEYNVPDYAAMIEWSHVFKDQLRGGKGKGKGRGRGRGPIRALTGTNRSNVIEMETTNVADKARYDEAMGKRANDYVSGILTFLESIVKEVERNPPRLHPDGNYSGNIPTVAFRALPFGRDIIHPKLEPTITYSCLALAMARIPTPRFPYKIFLIVPPNRVSAKDLLDEALEQKLQQLRAPMPYPSSVELCAPRNGNFEWVRVGLLPLDRLQRLMITYQTLHASWSGGYRSKNGATVPIRHVKYMLENTFFCYGNMKDRPEPIFGQQETKLLYLPGRSIMDVAIHCAYLGRKACALNAASAYHCGGGSLTGGRHASEESWCAQSTLLISMRSTSIEGLGGSQRCITVLKEENNRSKHRKFNPHLPQDAAVISPRVEVFRRGYDTGYDFLEEVAVLHGVASVAFYNRNKKMTDCPVDSPPGHEAYILGLKKKILAVVQGALKIGSEILIMQDFGCGVYENKPDVVGKCVGEVLKTYHGCFKMIILCGLVEFCSAAGSAAQIPEKDVYGRHTRREVDYRSIMKETFVHLTPVERSRNEPPPPRQLTPLELGVVPPRKQLETHGGPQLNNFPTSSPTHSPAASPMSSPAHSPVSPNIPADQNHFHLSPVGSSARGMAHSSNPEFQRGDGGSDFVGKTEISASEPGAVFEPSVSNSGQTGKTKTSKGGKKGGKKGAEKGKGIGKGKGDGNFGKDKGKGKKQ
eukprot:GEMP01012082.1.p1 GENE.GEMP01012082.1~~GEMP01012082.1.p1  ORF type:complete len:938 (+),score=198.64 GEMP01012082.1:147-2960(+)